MFSKNPLLISAFLAMMIFVSCKENKNTNNSAHPVEIDRFEMELFATDPDTLEEAISHFRQEYTDFLDVYSYHILGIGTPDDKDFPFLLRRFMEDAINREVYDEVMERFSDLGWLEQEFGRAFGIFREHFPEKEIPRVISYISRFSYPYFSVEGFIGTGLDMYLGPGHEFYDRLGLPQYQRTSMIPERIAPDAILNWMNGFFIMNDSAENVLSHLIHEGKMIYLLGTLFPEAPDSLLLGFTESQMDWCRSNEKQMWVYLIENEYLFSGELMDIRKLTGPAPFTSFFAAESPGRAAVWTGLQIVRDFMKRNQDVSLKALIDMNDYQRILRDSRYDP